MIPANIVEGREQKADAEFARYLRSWSTTPLPDTISA